MHSVHSVVKRIEHRIYDLVLTTDSTDTNRILKQTIGRGTLRRARFEDRNIGHRLHGYEPDMGQGRGRMSE